MYVGLLFKTSLYAMRTGEFEVTFNLQASALGAYVSELARF